MFETTNQSWFFTGLNGNSMDFWDFREIWTISVKKIVEHRFKERNYNNSRNTCHLPNVANYIYVFPLCIPMFGWFYHSFLVGG